MTRRSISVVIPAFNAESTIQRALDSVLQQSVSVDEVVIVDDGSDEPLSSQYRFPYPVRVIRQANSGAAAARNSGILASRSDLVAFLDADDYWKPTKIAKHLQLYDQHASLGLSFSRYMVQHPDGRTETPRRSIQADFPSESPLELDGRHLFDVACHIWTGTVVAPRQLLLEEPFRSGYEPAEDRELWKRLLARAPIAMLDQSLAIHVLEPNSLSRTAIDRDCKNMLRVVDESRGLLGISGTKVWRRHIYRRWAAEYLGEKCSLAIQPALKRWALEPWSLEATWIVCKSLSFTGSALVRIASARMRSPFERMRA